MLLVSVTIPVVALTNLCLFVETFAVTIAPVPPPPPDPTLIVIVVLVVAATPIVAPAAGSVERG